MSIGSFGSESPSLDEIRKSGGGGTPVVSLNDGKDALSQARDALKEGFEGYGGLRVAVGSVTRDTSVASGTQAVTGIGYKPTILILFMSIEIGTYANSMSYGLSNVTSDVAARFPNSANGDFSTTKCISFVDGVNSYEGEISSFDIDGFTITWTKTGTPTATIRVGYAAMR